MRMPFGKHKGEEVESIPTGYLQWMESELEHSHPKLFDEAVSELRYRDEFKDEREHDA